MASSSELGAQAQTLTFTSATTPPTVTASQRLTNITAAPDSSSASNALGTQYVRFSAIHSVSGGSATVVVFFADKDSVGSLGEGKFAQVTLTITATTTRTSHDTGAGGYVCTVTSSDPPLGNIVDIGNRFGKDWPRVYVGCTVLSGGTLTLLAQPGRSV